MHRVLVLLIALAPIATAANPSRAFADEPATVQAPAPALPWNPLARDYVDLEMHGGPVWLGNIGDGRWSPVGYGFGVAIDIGRAPFWAGVYVDVGIFSAKDGVVDTVNNKSPRLVSTSGGWHGKAALRISRRLYFMPSLGAGFGVLDYQSGGVRLRGNDIHDARNIGLGVQADARLVYAWRFGALTLEPIRLDAFLFERRSDSVGSPNDPSSFGMASNGVSLGASLGFSLDLSAMALAIWDSGEAATKSAVDAVRGL